MPIRDLFVSLVVFGFLPKILIRPDLGILLWCWLSYMNPHKLSWGFAHDFPFALCVALAILAGLLIWKESKKIIWMPVNVILILFIIWMFITTLFAVNQEAAWFEWGKVWKIQLMTFVTMILMQTRWRLEAMVWVIALSLGFYGLKGGIFTILTGGSYGVYGPEGSFISGNNEIGLALIMTVPLLRYCQVNCQKTWLKHGVGLMILFSLISIIGTQSRGALLGMMTMAFFLVAKSRQKFLLMLVLAMAIPAIFMFMPDSWHERMSTIKTYDHDASALGRINSWHMAFNLAKDQWHGGGFECFNSPMMFALYAPNPEDMHDAHSIYFEVLGEHGFIGLGLFLLLAFSTWRLASSIIRAAKGIESLRWLTDLSAMIQASLMGYASAGAFLGLAYFDLFYNLIAILVIGKTMVAQQAHAWQSQNHSNRTLAFVKRRS